MARKRESWIKKTVDPGKIDEFLKQWYEEYGTMPLRIRLLVPLAEKCGLFSAWMGLEDREKQSKLGVLMTEISGEDHRGLTVIRLKPCYAIKKHEVASRETRKNLEDL